MFHSFLQTLIILSTLTLCYTSYPPCSSLEISLLSSSNDLIYMLSQGCTLERKETFILPITLTSEGDTARISIKTLEEKGGSFLFQVLRKDENVFEVLSNSEVIMHSIPSLQENLVFNIKERTIYMTLGPQIVKVLGELKNHSSYTIAVEIVKPQEVFLEGKHITSRQLDQCPFGTFLVGQTCLRVCPINHFGRDGICYRCAGSCGRCLSEDKCNICDENQVYSSETDSCVERCPDFYFEDFNNRVCVKCMDGCQTCSFPNGLCTLNYFKTDMIINLVISGILFLLIVICACLCNKEKPEDEKPAAQNQQPKQEGDDNSEVKGKLKPGKKFRAADGQGPYNVLNEENEQETEEPSDNTPPRLSAYAKNKLLSLSLARKPFVVDDGNDEKAVSHDSASKILPRPASASIIYTKNEVSPLFNNNKGGIDALKLGNLNASGCGTPEYRRSRISVDEPFSKSNKAELNSPALQLRAKKETSLGLYSRKVVDTDEDKNSVMSYIPKVDEEEEEEKQKREGYKSDASYDVSKDQVGAANLLSCTICGMNKRDCLNQPCGHVVACYPCMKQFKENYGVCPLCKERLEELEKDPLIKLGL